MNGSTFDLPLLGSTFDVAILGSIIDVAILGSTIDAILDSTFDSAQHLTWSTVTLDKDYLHLFLVHVYLQPR